MTGYFVRDNKLCKSREYVPPLLIATLSSKTPADNEEIARILWAHDQLVAALEEANAYMSAHHPTDSNLRVTREVVQRQIDAALRAASGEDQ